MKQSILAVLALALVLPAAASPQLKPPIPIPGLGKCPDKCVSIRAPTGALLACCGKEEDGCVNCASDCEARCPDGKQGGCTDLGGGPELNCGKGCETFCDGVSSKAPASYLAKAQDQTDRVVQDYTLCSIGGQKLDPYPEFCVSHCRHDSCGK